MFSVALNTLQVFAIAFFGYVIRRRGMIDAGFSGQLSRVLVNVFYPCLIYATIVRTYTLRGILENWTLPAGAALIMAIGWSIGAVLLGAGVVRRMPGGADPRARRMLHFQCTMNNYSFLPLILVSLFWGEAGMARVAFSTLGAELVVWTLGMQALTGFRPSLASLRNLLSMPVFGIALALVTLGAGALLDRTAPAWRGAAPAAGAVADAALATLRLCGQATIPVAAIIVGARLGALRPRHVGSLMNVSITVLRCVLIPLAAAGALLLLPFGDEVRSTLLVIAAMPCAMVSVTLAEVYDGDAELAAASTLTSHLACLLTIPLWMRLFGIVAA